jgi:long-chain acyl-CoA synthetase
LKYIGALSDGTLFAPKMLENKLKFLPYIREAVAFGDGRATVCALIDIDIDTDAVGRWADRQSISYSGHADLASREEVCGLIADCIARVNAQLASEPAQARSQIHRFLLLPKELNADDGILTRTGKLRRGAIAERFKPLADAMYEGRTEVRFDTGGDLDGNHVFADLKIRDAKMAAPAQARRAA